MVLHVLLIMQMLNPHASLCEVNLDLDYDTMTSVEFASTQTFISLMCVLLVVHTHQAPRIGNHVPAPLPRGWQRVAGGSGAAV